jgi:hypothetical protein
VNESVLGDLARALADTNLSADLATRGWVIPALQSFHILCLSVVMASVGMLNLRVLLPNHPQSVRGVAERVMPWVWASLGLLALSGCILIIAEPARALLNWTFQLKMILVVVACLLTATQQATLRRDRNLAKDPALGKQYVARAVALVSMVVWIVILICGRWIAYT